MDFESPDVMKDFPGLYASEINKRCSNDSDYSDEGDKITKRDILIGKRKEKKDKKDKEKGYAALEGESSAEESYQSRSPSKAKKTKSFKFSSKSKEKREKSREKDREVVDKKRDKERKSEKRCDKDKSKFEKKERKCKHGNDEYGSIADALPIFGVSLDMAVERSRCHDGVDIPLPVRNCIDHIEAHGIAIEGVYKVSGTKSKVVCLKKMYNHREHVDLSEYEIPTVTSLLKMFLRDLPEALFTNDLLIRFEEAGAILNLATREKHLKILMDHLPSLNRLLLSWLFVHFDNIVANEKVNKMNKQHLAAALSPSLHTSVRLFMALISHCRSLFPTTVLFSYVPPLTSSAQLPEELSLMETELAKQESLLTQIHAEMNAGFISKAREELLWEVQRIITQLKRKLKTVQKEAVTDKCVEERHKEVENLSSVQEEPEEISPKEEPQLDNQISSEVISADPDVTDKGTDEIDEKNRCSIIDEHILLLKYKNQDLLNLKEKLRRQIEIQQKEILWLKGQLENEKGIIIIPVRNSANNLNEVMDLLKKENQILEIEKINLVRQIMEQQEICIELKARMSVLASSGMQ